MPTQQEVQSANPQHLVSNQFLVNLAISFNVVSIPLAIFILICICIACVLFIVLVIFIVRSCIKTRYVVRRKRRPLKTYYMEDIPGLVPYEGTDKKGALEYSLQYSMERQELRVGVIKASDINTNNGIENLDIYVTVAVYIDQGNRMKPFGKVNRTMKKQSSKPYWQETFAYAIPEPQLPKSVVAFELFAYDAIRQDTSIGQLSACLKDVSQSEYMGTVYEKTGWLLEGTPLVEGIGELCIGLGYYPANDRIDVTVYEAKQLKLDGISSSAKKKKHAIEVHIELKAGKKSLGSSTTTERNEIIAPYFNEKMSFTISPQQLPEAHVICTLRRKKRMLGQAKAYGVALIGPDSRITTGVKQWEEMTRRPKLMHLMWHTLVRPGYFDLP